MTTVGREPLGGRGGDPLSSLGTTTLSERRDPCLLALLLQVKVTKIVVESMDTSVQAYLMRGEKRNTLDRQRDRLPMVSQSISQSASQAGRP